MHNNLRYSIPKHQLINAEVLKTYSMIKTSYLDLDSLLNPSYSPLEDSSVPMVEFCLSVAAFGVMVIILSN